MKSVSRSAFSERLSNIYGEYLESVNSTRFSEQKAALRGVATTAITPLYSVQSLVRPLYGKGEPLPPDIGDHPDFKHLKGTDQRVYCPITTMFMDIESSTRLGLLYSPEEVHRIKNAFISAAIEIIRAFDGHVHRIMGDAVLAYFGGECSKPEFGAIDAINCAAFLRFFVEEIVIPKLNEEGYSDPFGIRVGLDYGPKEKVLWSSYGYPGMDEVTATSFHVDVAAKLQQSAGRNQIMLGQSLRDFIDFPEELLKIKKIERDGSSADDPFVQPNITDREGNPINYRKFQMRWLEYLECSPLPMVQKRPLTPIGPSPVCVEAFIHAAKHGNTESKYCPSSGTVAKGKWLKFKLHLPYLPMLPYTVRCKVKNHGFEAAKQGGESRGNHETQYEINTESKHNSFEHWEHVAYRGLHYLVVEVHSHGQLKYKTKFGVYGE